MLSRWVFALLLQIPWLIKAIPAPPLPILPTTLTTPGDHEGNAQDFDDVCPDYRTCSERGWGYWNKLAETLLNPNSRDRTDGFEKFQQYYTATMEYTESADVDIAPLLRSRGIDPDYLDVWLTLDKPKTPDTSHRKQPYQNAFNTRDGIIFAQVNYREDDDAKALEWSELMYQTWQVASAWADHEAIHGAKPHPKGGHISNLKAIVRSVVINHQTMEILRIMYLVNGYSPESDAGWRQWTEAGQPALWVALMGTDNVKGAVYLLNDHSQEMGKKIITDVWTRWDGVALDIW
ncbi:MAG: hypothetical protein Q9178_002353 [Gyalolechia marmorata]